MKSALARILILRTSNVGDTILFKTPLRQVSVPYLFPMFINAEKNGDSIVEENLPLTFILLAFKSISQWNNFCYWRNSF